MNWILEINDELNKICFPTKFVCFHLISWIECGEAKIRVTIRDHIQFPNLRVPQFHQNPITNPKITLRPTSLITLA